jgi:phosphate transport system substrate-binding protein
MRKVWLFAMMTTVVLALTGCTRGASDTVATDGSTSMEKVIGTLGEAFELEHEEVSVTYNPTGSGSGIQAVLDGRCDIGLSSRHLKEEETAAGLTETVLAYDGIAVIVNQDNPVSDLSMEELAAIYTGAITNWKEVGGEDAEIVLIGREAGSGTRDGFETMTDTAGQCRYRQELTSSGDVNTTVSSNQDAIGYTSLAAVKENVKVISVDGVAPNEETIREGSYAVQRPYLLVTKTDTQLSGAAQQFLEFAVSEAAGEYISFAGAIPAN